MPPTVARALAMAAIAFPLCHLVMEAKATTRGVSVKKLPKVRLLEAIEFYKEELDVRQ